MNGICLLILFSEQILCVALIQFRQIVHSLNLPKMYEIGVLNGFLNLNLNSELNLSSLSDYAKAPHVCVQYFTYKIEYFLTLKMTENDPYRGRNYQII